jgi:hypothetical protein
MLLKVTSIRAPRPTASGVRNSEICPITRLPAGMIT